MTLCFLACMMAVVPLDATLIKLLGEGMLLGQIIGIGSLMSLTLIAVFSSGQSIAFGILAISWACHMPCCGDGALDWSWS